MTTDNPAGPTMTAPNIKWLRDLADQLERAPRMGAETDSPEGSRVVQLSDTLVRLIVGHLRIMHAEKRLGDVQQTVLSHQVIARPEPPPNVETRDGDPTPR